MQFFKRKSLFVILIGIILLGSLIGYSLTNKNEVSTAEKFVMDSVGWLQNLAFQPITFVTDIFDSLSDIKKTYEENKLLREKVAEYKTLVYEVQELERENESLRQMLDLIDSPRDYEAILGTVIARSPERWIDQIIINQGKQHGIEKNMAVITGEGMVGKVKTVSNFTSTVQLITSFDQMNRMSAVVTSKKGAEVFGLIEGYDKEEGMLLFRIIDDSGGKIKEGDPVLSSSMGGMFPSGLLIGTIKEVTPDQYGLTKIAYVEPAADLKDINEVIVVKRKLDTVTDDELLNPLQIDEDEEEDE
ncbi:MAG TPA: rod shape-determining protein MreC [Pseudogracilibacillus sp.]|nr:rod shape-determining protein MreC [Pseudogracilibacillus sp.]